MGELEGEMRSRGKRACIKIAFKVGGFWCSFEARIENLSFSN
jgi:hypothetical protein